MFRLLFTDVDEYVQPNPERTFETLSTLVAKAEEDETKMFHPKEGMDAEEAHEAMREDPMPWYPEYARELHRLLRFSEHETIDQPLLQVHVISTESEDPTGDLERCSERIQNSEMASGGFLQPGMVLSCLVLHDKTAPAEQLEQTIQLVRSQRPNLKMQVVEIDFDGVGAEGNIPALGQGKSRALGEATTHAIAQLGEYVERLIKQEVLPWMEIRIRQLHSYISSTRKGFRNQLKSFLLGSSKRADEFLPESALFGATSIETQLRTLADLSFLIQDYELAASTYRLLSSDFKAKKAWKHYAGAQEWLGYSLGVAQAAHRDIYHAYENALNAYVKTGAENRAYAVRASLFWARFSACNGFLVDAANVLVQGAGIEGFSGKTGVLLESAAYCYVMNHQQPFLRKFVFNIVLAGHKYNQDGYTRHALRCYASVFEIFEESRWGYIKEHVAFMIGRKAKALGNAELEAEAFMSLLTCTHAPVETQSAYLDLFKKASAALSDSQKNTLAGKIGLPQFNMEDVHVHFQGQLCFEDDIPVQSSTNWEGFHKLLIPKEKLGSTTWLDGGDLGRARYITNNTVANEWIGADITVTNTLLIPLELPNVCLVSEFVDEKHNHHAREMLDVPELKVALLPREMRKLTLWIRPLCKGLLTIKGISWSFFGILHGERQFQVKGQKMKGVHPNSLHADQRKYSPCKRLSFKVLADMPRLTVELDGLESSTFEGEVCPFRLRLANVGRATLEKLRFCFDTSEIVPSSSASPLEVFGGLGEDHPANGNGHDHFLASSTVKGLHLNTFGASMKLEGGDVVNWPMWWSSFCNGNRTFRMAFYYESSVPVKGMEYRILHLTFTVTTTPLFTIATHRFESERSASSKVLEVRLQHERLGVDLRPQTIFSLDPGWTLKKLGDRDLLPECIQNGQEHSFVLVASEAKDGALGLSCSSPSSDCNVLSLHRDHQLVQNLLERIKSTPLAKGEWDVGLVLYWTADDPQRDMRWGLSRLVSLGVEEWGRLQAVLRPVVSESRHDFRSQPICVLQVDLHVHNGLPFPVEYWVSLSEVEDEPVRRGLKWRVGDTWETCGTVLASSSCFWSGVLTTAPTCLSSHTTTTIPLEVSVLSARHHRLKGCRLHWKRTDSDEDVQHQSVPSCTLWVRPSE